MLEHVVIDIVQSPFNRKSILWPFQPLKSKFGVKNCVPKRTVFANPVTYEGRDCKSKKFNDT